MREMLFSLVCVCLLALPALADPVYTIGMPCLEDKKCQLPRLESAFKEAYRRAGAEVEFRYLPLLRDLAEASALRIDACAVRSKSLLDDYPKLMAVPVPLFETKHIIYYRDETQKFDSLDALKNKTVAIIFGSHWGERLSREVGFATHSAGSIELSFSMLEAGRVDAVLHDYSAKFTHKEMLARMGIVTSDVVASEPLWHLVNVEHRDLAIKLEVAFREMIQDGSFAEHVGRPSPMKMK